MNVSQKLGYSSSMLHCRKEPWASPSGKMHLLLGTSRPFTCRWDWRA